MHTTNANNKALEPRARINKAYRLKCVTRAAIISSRPPPARAMHRTAAAGQIIAHLIGKVKNARARPVVRAIALCSASARASLVIGGAQKVAAPTGVVCM
jgi:hypothetical protein